MDHRSDQIADITVFSTGQIVQMWRTTVSNGILQIVPIPSGHVNRSPEGPMDAGYGWL